MVDRQEYYGGVRSDALALFDGPPGDRILEIGGGEFETLRSLAAPGVQLWGVDIREPRQKLEHFVGGSITDPSVAQQLPSEGFDAIIANDVIEHVFDTSSFVSTIHSKLRKGGLLLISVPNARQLRLAFYVFGKGTFPRTDAGLFDETHVRWFCKGDVRHLFEQAGFKTVKAKSVGRMVPKLMERSIIGEFLGLQNLFLFERV